MSVNMGWGDAQNHRRLGVIIGISGSALAADLPPSPPPPRAPAVYVPAVLPVYNWVGLYVGINGGWGWGNAKFTANAVGSGCFNTVPQPVPCSIMAAWSAVRSQEQPALAALGVNFQAGAFVFGIEGDWDYSAINTGTTASICTFSGQCQTGNNWLATVRGRAGYAADRVLLYLTGGGAFANVQTNFNGVTTSHTQSGWTAGGGIEWAFADNWTAKVEYLFVNLGNGSVNCATNTCLIASGTDGVHPNVLQSL
jgi:outer membrane immunogenic protein